jgi:hypothetical protein
VHCATINVMFWTANLFMWNQRVRNELYKSRFCSPRIMWLLPPPPPYPLPSASRLSFSVFLCVAGRAYWRERVGVMGGEDHTTARTHSILSGGNGRIRFRGRKTLIRTRVRPTQNVSDPEPQTLEGRHQTGANNNRTPEQEKGRKKRVWKKGII